jgi:hypothetical protein
MKPCFNRSIPGNCFGIDNCYVPFSTPQISLIFAEGWLIHSDLRPSPHLPVNIFTWCYQPALFFERICPGKTMEESDKRSKQFTSNHPFISQSLRLFKQLILFPFQ